MRRLAAGLLVAGGIFLGSASGAAAAPAFVPPGKAFGFNANLYPIDEPCCAISERSLDAVKTGGATHMRIGINWRLFENETTVDAPVPPTFSGPVGVRTTNGQTNAVDEQYLGIVNRGMTPILFIHSAPYWASTFHTCLTNILDRLNFQKCPPDWRTNANVLYPALDRMNALSTFAAAVARRYPLAVIEGTNEPDYQHHIQARYHPPIATVAEAQCAVAAGVRSADPTRRVLSAGMFRMSYAEPYIKAIGTRQCYDAFSLHIYGVEVRSGPSSGPRGLLNQLRFYLNRDAGGRAIWITETGLSNTFPIHRNTAELGERLVARAFPRYVTTLLGEPDVGAVIVHTLREKTFDETGANIGFAQLDPQYAVKDPGPGVLPRWCWLVLQNSAQYPGCEGWALEPPVPAAPTWFRPLEVMWPDASGNGSNGEPRTAWLLFFEEGYPLPDVSVIWYRCNGIGLGCVVAARNTSSYPLTEADRYRTIKATVIVENQYGTIWANTPLSPLFT